MRVSYSWLRDYVDVKIPPEKLGELLTMSGLAVESIEKIEGDHIFEIEVTSNRPDCLSVIGIAREVAALTGRKLRIPSFAKKPFTIHHSPFTIKVEDKKLCPRYTARIIRDVKVGESPRWLKARIEAMGLKAVNDIVDITNFCLFETGEPMHAFDLDKISRHIIIRRAKDGEKIITIDGIERSLDNSDLIIADRDRPIAIAGVMGGLDTEVTGSTKNILLEAAYFDPVSIRRTSRRLGISTESSYRFERRVDSENIVYSSNRAAGLISEICGGNMGGFIDIGKKIKSLKVIKLRYSRLNKILGTNIAFTKVEGILKSLELEARQVSKDKIEIRIPHFRYDLQDEIDIIEEISRIYGYDKIPKTIPSIVEEPTRESPNRVVESKVREILTSLGLDEIITYGLLSKRTLKMSGLSDKDCVEIKNPLSSEQEVMRPSLITGMLNAMLWNINRKNKPLKLFEVGNIYHGGSNGTFVEKEHLCIGITGQIYSSWDGHSRTAWFADLIGALETLLSEFGIGSFSYSLKGAKDERFSPTACAFIGIRGEEIGISGEVAPKILDNFDIKDKVYVMEINIELLRKNILLEKRFKELPRYPSALRDLSIIVGDKVSNADIIISIRDIAGSILKDIKLIDRYIGRQVPAGKVSLTYRLEYQDLNKTLEEKEVSQIQAQIIQTLETKFNARLR